MKEFLKWFGIAKTSVEVRDRINKNNLNLAVYATALVIVIEISLALEQLAKSIMSNFSDISAISLVLLHLYMFAVSYFLEKVAADYAFKGIYHRKRASISIYLFSTSVGIYAALLTTYGFAMPNAIMVFSVLLIVSLCLFVMRPVYIVCFIATIFTGIFINIGAADRNFDVLSLALIRKLVILEAIAVLLVSVSRFYFSYNAAKEHIKLERMTKCDWLTGLLNRQMMQIRFSKEMFTEPFRGMIMMADMDDFQFFNDLYGAEQADKVLQEVAGILVAEFGEDNVYRFGGDEYLVSWPCDDNHLNEHMMRSKMNRFMQRVSKYAKEWDCLDLTISAGYVFGEAADTEQIRSMKRQANRNLITAKRIGKNQAVGEPYRVDMREEDFQKEAQRVYKATDLDTLTGLPNMVNFRNYAERLIYRMEQEKRHDQCILYFDIENFKSYNQNYGFQMGDQLLKNIANKLSQVFSDGLVSRFSSDHFIVLTSSDNIVDRIKEVHEFVHAYQRNMRLEIKAGIYVLKESGNEIGNAMDRAKMALGLIKKRYDSDYMFYDSSMEKEREKKQYIVDHMEEAMAKGWIKVYYQPVVRTLTGEICGVEALSRWEDPIRGKISPADFVEVLEEAHLIHFLDTFVLEQVCKTYTSLHTEKIFLQPVSINLSRYDFQLSNIYDMVNDIVESYDMPKDLIHIEITESALTEDPDLLREQIKRFHDGGYQVWMDDFGSGYSSLNTLKDFHFDVLKLDMVFLKNFDTNPKVPLIISSIISMVKYMGIQTLAEGVETKEQAEFLRAVGCEKMQGYLFGIPMSQKTITRMNEEIPFRTEHPTQREYLDQVGRINMLSANPLGEMDGWEYNNPVPMGIIEFKNNHLEYLNYNLAFRNYIGNVGFVSVKDVENQINDPNFEAYDMVRKEIEYCLKTGRESKLTLVRNNEETSAYCKLIAKNDFENKAAFLITGTDRLMMKADELNMGSLENEAMMLWLSTRGLAEILGYESYDELLENTYNFEVDLTENRVINFYFGSDRLILAAAKEASGTYEEVVVQIVDGLTEDPDKREKMKMFYDRSRLINAFHKGIQYGNTENELEWDGQKQWLHTNYQVRENEDGHLMASFLVYNIGQFRQSEDQMWRMANTDALTGLFNRYFAENKIKNILESRPATRHCVMIQIDLDNFKTINDTYGHECGDNALVAAAKTLNEIFPGQAIVSRTGGDEFLIFIEECQESDVMFFLEKLMGGTTFRYGEDNVHFTYSVGYTIIPEQADEYEIAMKNADVAMYASKEKGKGCYSKFKETMKKQWR